MSEELFDKQQEMSAAEYENITSAYPAWAQVVSREADILARDVNDSYSNGVLYGLAAAMVATRQCYRAFEYAAETVRRSLDMKEARDNG